MREHSEIEGYSRFALASRTLKEMEECAHDELALVPDSEPAREYYGPHWHELDSQYLIYTSESATCLAISSSPESHRRKPSLAAAEKRVLEERVQMLEEKLAELLAERLAEKQERECLLTTPLVRSILEELTDLIVVRSTQIEGVTSAYISPDGREFILAGPEWTERLSEAGAALAIEAQRRLAPNGEPYIDGSFIDLGDRPIPGWAKVYP